MKKYLLCLFVLMVVLLAQLAVASPPVGSTDNQTAITGTAKIAPIVVSLNANDSIRESSNAVSTATAPYIHALGANGQNTQFGNIKHQAACQRISAKANNNLIAIPVYVTPALYKVKVTHTLQVVVCSLLKTVDVQPHLRI